MKPAAVKFVPGLVAASVIGLVCLAEILPSFLPRFEVFQRLEWMTYDWRVRNAFQSDALVAQNLGAVLIDDESISDINEAYRFTWPFPRQLHGKVIEELRAQGAKAVAFDILFSELHPPNPAANVEVNGSELDSDEYFALQLSECKNVVLAAMGQTLHSRWRAVPPHEFFAAQALAIGHITSESDSDGVLRRALAFRDDPKLGRLWNMGIVLAALELGADLGQTVVESRRLVLRTAKGEHLREIPIESDGSFYINWRLAWNDPRIAKASFVELLRWQEDREFGEEVRPLFQNGLVVIGSIASGNNVSDVGATPIAKEDYLVGKHWNVANSILTGNFITRSSLAVNVALIILLGALAAITTWTRPPLAASLIIFAMMLCYTAFAVMLFTASRYWLPIVLPIGGALFTTHVCLVTHRVIFEQNERRRVKAVFARVVSPEVVNELLSAEKLSLGGARRQITIFFADVRGFTELTDSRQAKIEQFVRDRSLTADAAERYYDENARETLETVNLYLSAIADVVKKHGGTLDKYIGDCVMAFWGAPASNDKHALCCVRAAIESQRTIHALNQERSAENQRRDQENARRAAAGEPMLDPLPLLALGSGINSGPAVVGLMGSDAHFLNYTVFGREVNLASRLEGVSGRSRIIISESTFRELQRDDPALASTCVELPAVSVKGFREPIKIFEVPWK